MKLLLISDVHAQSAQFEKLSDEFDCADMVLCAGDFAALGKRETADSEDNLYPTLNAFLKTHTHIFAVSGNCDENDLWQVLEENDVSVERLLVSTDGLLITGSGGALHFTGETPNERSEEDIESDFTPLYDILRTDCSENDKAPPAWDNLLIIAHHPPKDTALDVIANGVHVGSHAVRAIIEKTQPLLVLSGHIHESFAVDTIGSTTVINPGSLAEGRYATVEIEKKDGTWVVISAVLKRIS